MDKLSTACSYAVSCGSFSYWMMHWLLSVANAFTPDQWTAIGVLGSLLFAALTFIVNLIFKIYDRCKTNALAYRGIQDIPPAKKQ